MQIRLTPTISYKSYPTYQNAAEPKEKKSYENAIKYTSVGIGVLLTGTAGLLLKGKASVMSFEKALEKKGIELKKDIAYIKSTGEKYTGKISRNVSANKRETVVYKDGLIEEKVYHNAFGKEQNGYFYKDGQMRYYIGDHSGFFHKCYMTREFKDGKVVSTGDAFDSGMHSKFKLAREHVKALS